ncbi:MAG: hypothetical protein CL843_09450 [Crocinitomicaceae bacterium]|nr:hypothetical protein [Crocinitomicaceae bacterium]|tara:strand:+ start:10533 stop:11195 length:663 start_codon:yes stop_codon:yes gene_type:complete
MRVSVKQVIDGLYETIRLKLVELGRLPDVKSYLPSNPVGYKTELDTLRENGELIYIVNDSHHTERGKVKQNTIFISYKDLESADNGRLSDYLFTKIEDSSEDYHYEKYKTPNGVYDVLIDVRFETYSTTISYFIDELLIDLFKSQIVKPYDMDSDVYLEQHLECIRENPYNVSDVSFIEKGSQYRVKDVDIIGNVLIRDDVAVTSDFKLSTDPQVDSIED